MAGICEQLDRFKNKGYHGFFEDFEHPIVSGDRWTPVVADLAGATFAVLLGATGTAATGGILSFVNDATDNDEAYLGSSINQFLIAQNKHFIAECRMQYAEANTDDNNAIFGFVSGTAGVANSLLDNGGGPLATATMALFYKVDGGTVWRCRSQIGAAVGQTDTITNTTAGGSAYQVLTIEGNPVSSTVCEIVFSIDGKQVRDSNGYIVKHQLTYTNAINMGIVWGGKAGSANAETMLCDYIAAYQKR